MEILTTYAEMNNEIADILRLSDEHHCLYAAQLIEEQQAEISMLKEKLERSVELPCKVNDIVYVIVICEDIVMSYDGNYEHGTGAIDCPFENQCSYEECHDNNKNIFETIVMGFMILDDTTQIYLEDIKPVLVLKDFGKTVFLTKEEAEQALKEREKK